MSEMAVPDWVNEAKEQMHGTLGAQGSLKAVELNKILDFSTLFAEYEVKDETLLVHLFPRAGGEDRYYPAELKPDGKRIPGRLELSLDSIQFPDTFVELAKMAADKVWMGEVAIEPITVLHYPQGSNVENEEPVEKPTGAWVVQFQDARGSAESEGVGKFVDRFCEALDSMLER